MTEKATHVNRADESIFARPSALRAPKAGLRVAWAGWAGWTACAVMLLTFGAALAAGRGSGLGFAVCIAAVVLSVPWFSRLARLTPTIELAGLLRLALAVKLLATMPRFVSRQDSIDYHRIGARLADSFRSLDFAVDTGAQIPGTGSVRYLTGLVEVATFEDEHATFLVFAMFGFVGVVLFVQAFISALPAIDPLRYVVMVLFWPSLIYWPASIGKDTVLVLALGASSLGVAGLLQGRYRGLVWAVAGLSLGGLVRPHVALIGIVAGVVGLILHSPRKDGGGWIGRGVIIGGLLFAGAVASDAVERVFSIDGLNSSGLAAALDLATLRSEQGGSAFAAARIDTIADVPWGVVTVLFRPFLYEATSPAMLMTSLEGLVLAVLAVGAVPRAWASLKRIRDEAYVGYVIAFASVFVYLFSALGNFGILARQRSMVLPFVLVLVALPTARERVRAQRLASAPRTVSR